MQIILRFVLTYHPIIFITGYWIHLLYHDEIVNHVERAQTGSLFMKHGNADNCLEKLKKTLLLIMWREHKLVLCL